MSDELGFDEQIGWELYFYDSDGDDGRGASFERGLYLHRSTAQAECDKLNASKLAKYNEDEAGKHARDLHRHRETKLLFDHGLRASYSKDPGPFHAAQELPSNVDHYGVRAIEWEDVK